MAGQLQPFYFLLFLVSFVTAVVSASVGFLGGTILLTVMAQFLPPPVLIPLHGLVQFWANSTRVMFLLRSVNWKIVGYYALGTVFGSLLASQYVLDVPEKWYNLGLGIIVLILTFTPKEAWGRVFRSATRAEDAATVAGHPVRRSVSREKWVLTGFVASFVGLFVGAIGVLVGSVFLTEKNLDKREIVSTQAACQMLVHIAKVIVFIYLGFQIGPWLLLLAGLIFTTLAGSYVGTRILDKIPQALFLKLFKGVIIILCLRLIASAIFQ